jgi:transaldolase
MAREKIISMTVSNEEYDILAKERTTKDGIISMSEVLRRRVFGTNPTIIKETISQDIKQDIKQDSKQDSKQNVKDIKQDSKQTEAIKDNGWDDILAGIEL